MSASESAELLLEIGCEEIPADWLSPLVEGFGKAVADGLHGVGLHGAAGEVEGCGTPRRLVARARSAALRQPDRLERITGPPARVGRDENGWTRAAVGFARRHGIESAELDARMQLVSTPRGDYLGIERRVLGRPAMEVLPGVVEGALRALPFRKTMHWDASISGEPFPFGRPIRWIVALLGGQVIPFRIEVAGGEPVVAGNRSRGHRFRSRIGKPGESFEVDSFASLRKELRERFVILDPKERQQKLSRALDGAARGSGGLFETPSQHHHLVEYPGAVLGRYSEDFRALPMEIRRAVLVHHQKYLPVEEECAFLAVVNMPDDPQGHIRRGVERVVRARLRDARFFWDGDRKTRLAERRAGLAEVVFHQRLGSLGEKADRMERLARWIASRIGAAHEAAAEAAGLAKCDLTSGLVGEFASLQGVVGGLLLREEGAPKEIWSAVYDHYRPAGLDGELPRTVEGAAVSLADRADTLAGFFLAGEAPSGSGDPYGLRRAAFSLLRTLADGPALQSIGDWPSPAALLDEALSGYPSLGEESARRAARADLHIFLEERLHHAFGRDFSRGAVRTVLSRQLSRRGVELRVDDARMRIHALEEASSSGDLSALSIAATRVRRILPPEAQQGSDPRRDLLAEPAEEALLLGLEVTEARVRERFGRDDYTGGLSELAALRPQVDRFFDEVLVMVDDPEVRANRLALLARLDALFSQVGDLRELAATAAAER